MKKLNVTNKKGIAPLFIILLIILAILVISAAIFAFVYFNNQTEKDSLNGGGKTTQEEKTSSNSSFKPEIGVAKRVGPWEFVITDARVVTDSGIEHLADSEVFAISFDVTNRSTDTWESDWRLDYETDTISVGGPPEGSTSPWAEMAPGESWSTTIYYRTPTSDEYRELIVGAAGQSATFKLMQR